MEFEPSHIRKLSEDLIEPVSPLRRRNSFSFK